MSSNANYWTRRQELSQNAKEHTETAEKTYAEEIEKTLADIKIYDTDFLLKKPEKPYDAPEVIVEDLDSTEAVMKYAKDKKCAVLDFASYKNPGGKFLEGSSAQEESLCHASYIYNVLSRMKDFYAWNNVNLNRAQYKNRGLYLPDVSFAGNEEDFKEKRYVTCDVIVCAAPNISAGKKYDIISESENSRNLMGRCRFVLDMAKDNNIDTVILGAYGCGVFGQRCEEVAECFKSLLMSGNYPFRTAIFPIPEDKNGNLEIFKKVFD